jgi:hypothetical protein
MAELTVISTRRKIIWEPVDEPAPVSTPQVTAYVPNEQIERECLSQRQTLTEAINVPSTHRIELPEGSTLVVQPKRGYKKRTGNGHKGVKVRDLYDSERDAMRHQLFLPKNGQIDDDDCVAFRNSQFNPEIGIFQVTGFVSVLHRYVAEGRMEGIRDLAAYENWMRVKYGGSLWARYNHPLYVDVRRRNQDAVAQGRSPTHRVARDQTIQVSLTPKFTAFKKRWAR